MLNIPQLLTHVIRPTLRYLDMWSPHAEALVLGTGLAESRLHYLKQVRGPAYGLYQIEPATHTDVWRNYLDYRGGLRERVTRFLADWPEPREQLATNLVYATAICRVIYWRVPTALPTDAKGLAHYHKDHYNTALGKADPAETREDFEFALREVVTLA